MQVEKTKIVEVKEISTPGVVLTLTKDEVAIVMDALDYISATGRDGSGIGGWQIGRAHV